MRTIILSALALLLVASSCETKTNNTLPNEGLTSHESIGRIATSQDKTVDEITAIFQECIDAGGEPLVGGFGQPACDKPTKDAGKACKKDSECESFCLADTKSCAPKSPMFGCFDVLPDGRRATICVD